MQRTIGRLSLSLLGLWLICGCSRSSFVENNTIEEIAPVIFWLVKDAGDGQLNIGTLVPPLLKDESKRFLFSKVSLLRQGSEKFNLNYYRQLKNGQLRMILIDKKLAQKGIRPLIDTLHSDPDVSQRVFLVITDGDVEGYIRTQMDKQKDLDYYLYRMLKHYESKRQGNITVVNLFQYMKSVHSRFSDPSLPAFQADKENFTYSGTALMKDDKLLGTVQGGQEQVMQLIGSGRYLEHMPIHTLRITVGRLRSAVRTKVDRKLRSVSIRVSLTGRIDEYWGRENILDPEGLSRLRDSIEDYLEGETKELLKRMQQWGIDPLEVGRHTLSPFGKPLSDRQWMEAWSHMPVEVDYRLDLAALASPSR